MLVAGNWAGKQAAMAYFRGLSGWQIALFGGTFLLLLIETAYSIWWGVGDILIRTVPATHAFYKDGWVDLVLGTSLAQDSIYFLATAILTASFVGLVWRKAWTFWAYVAAALLFNLDWILTGLAGNDHQPAAGYFSLAYAGVLCLLLWLTNRFEICR